MTKFKLNIEELAVDQWLASAEIVDNDGEKLSYVIPANSLDEIRKSVEEGIAGDLSISDIEFEEVFNEASSSTDELNH